MKNFDPTFGIDPQARALLQVLSTEHIGELPEGAQYLTVETYPFYNGRERWVGITVRPDIVTNKAGKNLHGHKALHIIFGENRKSDDLCVQHWYSSVGMNPPTLADMPEASYSGRSYFGYLKIHQAADHIYSTIRDYYQWLEGQEG
jgi:hypothetical protein